MNAVAARILCRVTGGGQPMPPGEIQLSSISYSQTARNAGSMVGNQNVWFGNVTFTQAEVRSRACPLVFGA